MKPSADLSGLRSRRFWLTILAFIAALAVSLALYVSLGVRSAVATHTSLPYPLQCGFEQKFVRNLNGHNSQNIPIFAPDCSVVGQIVDHFGGGKSTSNQGNEGKNFVHEGVQAKNFSPNTAYRAFVDVRFDCNQPEPVFIAEGESFVTNKQGKAHTIIKVAGPNSGEATPIPPFLLGQTLCYTYRFEGADGSAFSTPPTLARLQ